MDDSCAVCADSLEWVAYGACGHKDVCSTCVARLRFICDDRRCCICKTPSDVVFVTKALGDYTKMIKDFSVLPAQGREGRSGPYWYHEDTQAFFDDVDHYKMIKAMCKLSCSECDKAEEQTNDNPKRRPARFRNIGQLKGHLYHQHRLSMCPLCLEARKVFICEQKLYTKAQLKQHISTGDSEVDGSESERGGFMGHPMCDFCGTPFYGDNEHYTHMGTEHFKCHLCHGPGQYEFFRNYDDLEMHFRHSHFLCEDESCLAKKFIVFQSEAEMKRHNTIEHAGRMSRSKRNAALQIPTSFRYRRSSEQDNRRGRGRSFHRESRDSSDSQLSMAIQASLETSPTDDSAFHGTSSSTGHAASDLGDTNDIDPIISPFESLSTTDAEASSRYLQALGGLSFGTAPLQDSSFPPLAPGSSQSTPISDGLPNNSMAAHLRRQNKRKVAVKPVISASQAWPAAGRAPVVPPSSSAQAWPTTQVSPSISRGSGQNKKASGSRPGPSSYASSAQAQVETRQTTVPGFSSSVSSARISHSAPAPNLVENGTIQPSISDFPPVSAAQVCKMPSTNQPTQPILKVADVQTANKSLVEKIRAAVDFDEEKYSVFKDISGQYRQGLVDTDVYLDFVRQFGLLHLVLDLARLCPDTHKQRELIDAYNKSMRSNGAQDNGWSQGNVRLKDSKKGKGKSLEIANSKSKGKSLEAENSSSADTLADSIINSVRELQSNHRPLEEVVEVLSKDGYRAAKGKSKLIVDERQDELNSRSQAPTEPRSQKDPVPAVSGSSLHLGDGGGGSKQRKKTSKFHRVRLGDGSAAALLDLKNSDPQPDNGGEQLDGSGNSAGGLPVHGVWRHKAANKLFS
ncbi:PREDICTED: zinc finger protein 598 [Fragaria vesca subsp. vesca]|uniref:zinc finger protein 598 n=1 Tax=Fragaria vesca subsp. vesca TaxID=101020 RepID=UPI0002C2F6AA|nr:PREDICTED: zinc finger protein 598 [Fragaria vesca subsp. vesca]